ncbi:MAG: alpha/beta fold hydrolase [Thermoactinospora sp.]|nr:alpha/beta fold hydrolase [Thermoactinospora sp.]
MRAREADTEGFVERGGVKIHYEVYGSGGPAILLMPAWTVVHKRIWKMQVAFLSRRHRVVVYDGPGNGGSDRPLVPSAYDQAAQVSYALAVMDATGLDRAVLVALSRGANWALELAAEHPARVLGTVLIAPAVPLAKLGRPDLDAPAPRVGPSSVRQGVADPASHWVKYNRDYWTAAHEDFLWFFMGQCLSEPHSTKGVEDGVAWGLETTGAVLVAESHAVRATGEQVRSWCAEAAGPVLVVHGDDDHVVPPENGRRVAELTGGRLETIAGGGHLPQLRDPVRVNLLIGEFAARLAGGAAEPVRRWERWTRRERRVLYLSSPIGLGHARRDLAIARELRALHPGLRIDWLAQDPVTRALEAAGERVHPASRWLAGESAHIESEAGEHDLHCFEALRGMDEILLANFMLFDQVVRDEAYDLVVADEAWEVDHFLHDNPELKRFAFAWLTDFVGVLPMPGGGEREALVAADYNTEMIRRVERFPWLRDRALFVGDPEDVVEASFGPGLPGIREWTAEHFRFSGYVTGFGEHAQDRDALRARLGYEPGERVCVVSVGGSGVGADLLDKVAAAYPQAARRVPGLRMVVVTGPRIDPSRVARRPGLDVHAYVPDLHLHLAACDLAVVQGGLSTCMELTAAARPFIYVPLRNHFEQQFHVAHRLRRHRAGRRLDYAQIAPDLLAEIVATELGRQVDYRPVPGDGAARAAAMLADLL